MSDYLIQQIRHLGNVEVRLATEVVGGAGEHALERLTVRDLATGRDETVPAQMLFVLVGALPHTDWLAGVVARDAHGFILTGADADAASPGVPGRRRATQFETSLPGVFAIGDVRGGSAKHVAAAVGEGAAALQEAYRYLDTAGELDGRSAAVGPSVELGKRLPLE